MHDSSFGWRFINPKMERTIWNRWNGPNCRKFSRPLHGISREDQDLFAYNSQMKATKAIGKWQASLKKFVLLTIPQRKKDDLIFEIR